MNVEMCTRLGMVIQIGKKALPEGRLASWLARLDAEE
jgi:hypothetical protein